MSEVHDQAIHLLATPQYGTYLDPDQREVVLRALDEVDSLRKEVVRLQEVAAASQKLFGVKVARVEFLMHDDGTVNLVATVPGSDEKALAVYCGEQLQRVFDEAALLKDSPAAPKECVEVPSATPLPNGAAGDVSLGNGAGSNAPPTRADAPAHGEQREHRLCKPEDGGVAPPASVSSDVVARWGRADGRGAFHLWREGFSESECNEEVCDGEVLLGDPIPDNACLSCAAIAGWDVPEKMSKPETQPELPTIKRTCAGFNKSANVVCGSPNVSIQRGTKWFCRRHDPEKSKVCLVPGCGAAGRTAKGSPGIWCKEHGEKLSAEERTAMAERGKRLEAANG